MLELDDKIHIGFLSVLDFSAIVINSFYIFIIRKKTPKDLSAYAFLLLNIACVDLLSAFCNFMSINRILFDDGAIVYVYIGPCTLMNAQVCHFFESAHLEFLGQSVLLLLISFMCRLWMFKANYKMNLDIATILERIRFAAVIIAIHTALSITAFFLGGSYQPHSSIGNHTISNINLFGDVTENILPRCAFGVLFVTFTAGFGAVFVMHRRLFVCLKNLTSVADRSSHKQIYHSLTAQMLLPLVYQICIFLWFLDVVGLVRSRTLQRTVLTATCIFPILSPLINMYYIPPYRRYLKSLLASPMRVATKETSEFTVQSVSRF